MHPAASHRANFPISPHALQRVAILAQPSSLAGFRHRISLRPHIVGTVVSPRRSWQASSVEYHRRHRRRSMLRASSSSMGAVTRMHVATHAFSEVMCRLGEDCEHITTLACSRLHTVSRWARRLTQGHPSNLIKVISSQTSSTSTRRELKIAPSLHKSWLRDHAQES